MIAYICTKKTLRTAADGIEEGTMSMVQNIVNSINTWRDWYAFSNKVYNSKTYKHGWFVYADCFNEKDVRKGVTPKETCLGKGLTKGEATAIYEANKYAVENNGTDYAEIYMTNLYEPSNWSSAPFIYERATGEKVTRAFELLEICRSVHKKLKYKRIYVTHQIRQDKSL